jgi:hypothetical protein
MKIKHKILTAAAVSLLAISTLSVASAHDDYTEKRNHKSFEVIVVKGAISLELVEGDDYSVEIMGNKEDVKQLVTTVKDNMLIFANKDNNWTIGKNHNNSVKVTMTMPKFTGLTVKGAIDAHISELKGNDITIILKGAGNIELFGSCDALEIDMKGAGNIEADQLECKDVEVELKGAGNIEVFASDSVDADISGVGNIDIYGKPKRSKVDSGFLSNIEIH